MLGARILAWGFEYPLAVSFYFMPSTAQFGVVVAFLLL